MKTKRNSFQTRNEAWLSCAILVCAALVLPSAKASAEWNPAAETPYAFGPEGRPIDDIQQFGRPNEMMNFLPNRPISARDKYGNRVFFSADGEMTVRMSQDGSMEFTTKGMVVNKDANGNIISTAKNVKGTNKVEIRNEKGEILGYQTVGYGGKVLQEFDHQGNLTKTNTYDVYGKTLQCTVDELSLSKTIYDKNGNPVCDKDFEGAVVARYSLDSANRVQSKTDLYGNITHFSESGNMTYSEDNRGQKTSEYHYRTDDMGRTLLDFVEDVSPGIYSGDRTYFQNGKQSYTVSRFGDVAREYHYDGTTLVYSFDTRTNETTWYDINGKSLCNTFNEYKTKEWLYYKSRLVGYYDDSQKMVVMYQYERQDQQVKVFQRDDKPTAEDIESYYESRGMMAAIGTQATDPGAGRKAPTRFTNIVSADDNELKKTDFTTVSDAPTAVLPDRAGLTESQYTYANGKLQSILSRAPDDGSGMVTQVFLDAAITLTGDQRENVGRLKELWNTVMSGENLGDIAAGDGELAQLARSIKTIGIDARTISGMSDRQICNLFGWNQSASYTRTALEDLGTRVENAGYDGSVSVLFGFDEGGLGSRIYAARISATDSNSFVVGGLNQGTCLNLTSEEAWASLVVPAGAATSGGNIVRRDLGGRQAASAELVQTVNGLTRTYSRNGVILSEEDALTQTRTVNDTIGRISAVYRADGNLDRSYTYGRNGTLESVKQMTVDGAGAPAIVTTFYVGWGGAQSDQPEITVAGDQTANAALAAAFWTAINNGTSIAEIASGAKNPELTSFAQTIQMISINPNVALHASDQQLGALLGNAPLSAIDNVRHWAQKIGVDGKFAISYAANALSANRLGVSRGTQSIAVINLTPLPVESAIDSVLQDLGVDFVSNAAAGIASAVLGQ